MKDQFFADYLQRLEDLQHRLHKEVRNLPLEAMDWVPGPEMNSVAVLLAHISGLLHEGIDIALDEPPSRVRAQEFQTRGVLSAESRQCACSSEHIASSRTIRDRNSVG